MSDTVGQANYNAHFCPMYHLLLFHSILRWFVLATMLWVIGRAVHGLATREGFRRSDQILVSSASGFAQLQLLVGFGLYFWSPIAQGFWANRSFEWSESLFFGVVHFALMTLAVVILSIGSAMAKRAGEEEDAKRFKALLVYYSLALILILIAIPWPFSPLVQRPYFRPF